MAKRFNADFTLGNCLFEPAELTDPDTDPDKYYYSGCGKGFDSRPEFTFTSFTDGSVGENFIIFGAGMSSSVRIDEKNNDVLILGEGLTQGLDDTTLIAEGIYPINFTQSRKRFVLSPHYDGSNSFLFVNAKKKYISSKQKTLK